MSHTHLPDPLDSRYREIRTVTLVGAAVDLLLGVVKIFVGSIASSQALIADGIHSLSDLATDFLVLFASKHAHRQADDEHPYGHGRIETVATVVLGVALGAHLLALEGDPTQRNLTGALRARATLPAHLVLEAWLHLDPSPSWFGQQGLRRWFLLAGADGSWAWAVAADRSVHGQPVVQGEVQLEALERQADAAGDQQGKGYSGQANLMDKDTVWPAMALAFESAEGDLADAVRSALGRAQGAYALAVIHKGEPDRVVGAKMNVPLIVGIGEDGLLYLAQGSTCNICEEQDSRRATMTRFQL